MKVFYTPAALRDLDEIADWLAVTRQLLLPSSAESATPTEYSIERTPTSSKYCTFTMPRANLGTSGTESALYRFLLHTSASKLSGPPPAKTKYRNTKQNRIAGSPPLSSGKKLRGAWSRK